MDALLLSILGTLLAGHLAYIAMWMTGQIVSGGKYSQLENAARETQANYDKLARTIERQAETNELTNKLVAAVRQGLSEGGSREMA